MKNFVNLFLKDILWALYQPFGYAILMAVLLMVLYLYMQELGGYPDGLKAVFWRYRDSLLHSSRFRRLFCLAFYTVMILFRTLMNRNLWENPLSDLLGGWLLTDESGSLNMEPLENLILFIPFTVLLFWAEGDQILKGRTGPAFILWRAGSLTFCFSAGIEFCQLFLRLGTFQFSDLFYNTLGGVLGGLICCSLKKCGRQRKADRKSGQRKPPGKN